MGDILKGQSPVQKCRLKDIGVNFMRLQTGDLSLTPDHKPRFQVLVSVVTGDSSSDFYG